MNDRNQEADKLLQQYRDRHALKYKDIFKGYFMAVQEFAERTGQQPPDVLFVLNNDTFKATEDDDSGFNLERVNRKSRTRSGQERDL